MPERALPVMALVVLFREQAPTGGGSADALLDDLGRVLAVVDPVPRGLRASAHEAFRATLPPEPKARRDAEPVYGGRL